MLHRTNAVLSFRRILLAVAFLINASFVLAQFPVDLNHPSNDAQPAQMRELVSKYCRLDYEGVSLDPQSWSKIQPLVWWKSSPEYTQIDVVSRYTVDSEPESKNGKYVAEVTPSPVIETWYKPKASNAKVCGTVKLTWNSPGATVPARLGADPT